MQSGQFLGQPHDQCLVIKICFTIDGAALCLIGYTNEHVAVLDNAFANVCAHIKLFVLQELKKLHLSRELEFHSFQLIW